MNTNSQAYKDALKGLKRICKIVSEYEGDDVLQLHSLAEELEFQGQQYMEAAYKEYQPSSLYPNETTNIRDFMMKQPSVHWGDLNFDEIKRPARLQEKIDKLDKKADS